PFDLTQLLLFRDRHRAGVGRLAADRISQEDEDKAFLHFAVGHFPRVLSVARVSIRLSLAMARDTGTTQMSRANGAVRERRHDSVSLRADLEALETFPGLVVLVGAAHVAAIVVADEQGVVREPSPVADGRLVRIAALALSDVEQILGNRARLLPIA